MRNPEEVTFGGSGLDRAAELRTDPAALAALWRSETARVIVLWRGKPLITQDKPAALMRVATDHPVLGDSDPGEALFLGRDGDAPVFAADISAWTPDDLDTDALGAFADPTEQIHPDCPEGRFAELRRIMTWLSPRDAELAATARAVLNWHLSHAFCSKCGAPSDMAQAGWQRRCPRCGAGHFPRTDPVVIMLVTHGPHTLLGRSPGWPEGMYSCLAGFVEPGETIEAAVRREVFEETGVTVGPVRYLASQPWAFPNSLMIGCHGVAESIEITIDPAEIEAAQWVTRERLVATMAGHETGLLPAREGAIAHFMLRNWLADRID
ncbi:NAD(+) diphosphatase [Roseivivax lentus]|uniref:NAD(+) diphosphatase n=1 Tax=Roseivivax lentus TaxID=633194 RepID=UPI000970E60A|nr:NAD(+) diphosphatase [Roseivivax lentus]